MSNLEALLREAWEAGYESASSDVPKDREFESFMERTIERLTGPEPKPQVDWSEAPERARYWAMDFDGLPFWYFGDEPVRNDARGRFECTVIDCCCHVMTVKILSTNREAPDFDWPKDMWAQSLVKRPQAEEPASDDLKKQIEWIDRDVKTIKRQMQSPEELHQQIAWLRRDVKRLERKLLRLEGEQE